MFGYIDKGLITTFLLFKTGNMPFYIVLNYLSMPSFVGRILLENDTLSESAGSFSKMTWTSSLRPMCRISALNSDVNCPMKIIDLNRVQNYFKKSQGVIFYFSFSMKTINCNNLIKNLNLKLPMAYFIYI